MTSAFSAASNYLPASPIEYLLYTVATALLSILVASFIMPLFGRNQFPLAGRTAVITGGSQGLGLSIACKFASRGANVVIVARDTSKLASALELIKSRASAPSTQKFHSLSYDLTESTSAPEIIKLVTQWNNGSPPEIVFCAAGLCLPGFFADVDIATQRGQMETLYWTAAYMAHATMKAWIAMPPSKEPSKGPRPEDRHLIFTCSTLTAFPVAGYGPYSVAKAAMKTLADTLTHESTIYNAHFATTPNIPEIQIHTIYPMGIASPNYDIENELKPAVTRWLEGTDDVTQQPDEVADIVLRKLEQGQISISTMFLGHLMRGLGLSGTMRKTWGDIFWNIFAQFVVLPYGWNDRRMERQWGRERGLFTGPGNP